MTDYFEPPIDRPKEAKVIDIGDARVSRGKTRRPFSGCHHFNLCYDPVERRVFCLDCESYIDPFDAFTTVVGQWRTAYQKLEIEMNKIREARKKSLHLIACKNLEKKWRGKTMAVPCPHCSRGLLPQDFKQITAASSAELELARRKKEGAP